MNNVLGKYDNRTFLCTFDTANFKIFFTWTKGIVEQRVSRQFVGRNSFGKGGHCGIRQHCVNKRDLLHFVFWKSDKVTHELIGDWRIPPKHTVRRGTTLPTLQRLNPPSHRRSTTQPLQG